MILERFALVKKIWP